MTSKTTRPTPLSKTQTVTVRLDPKLRYLLELAARKHRRTISSYIEWAVEASLRDVHLLDNEYSSSNSITIADEANTLWDVDESERFIRLAINYPELLDITEQEKLKMLFDSGLLEPAIDSFSNSGTPIWNKPWLLNQICPIIRDLWLSLEQAHSKGWNAQREWIGDIKKKIDLGEITLPQSPRKLSSVMSDDLPF